MNTNKIPQYNEKMQYRRFGKTNKMLSVITLGGMRYKHVWDEPRNVISDDTLEQAVLTVERSFKMGINHIETAHGYTKSEHIYGKVLNEILKIPRQDYYLMTKGNPSDATQVNDLVKKQQDALQTDYFDFYAWHGINNERRFDMALGSGKAVEALLKLKQDGVIKHLGFSTHGQVETILKAIETDLFDFVNLHYYYFFQRNLAAIQLAQTKDMGVFIISPNDKGGQLFDPPEKLQNITAPLTPLQWNARFCLSNPAIHTLSFGMTAKDHMDYMDEVPGIMPVSVPFTQEEAGTMLKMEEQKLLDPYALYDGYDLQNDPSGINIPEVLRLRMLWKCYDLLGYGKYRYNTFREEDEWYQGAHATEDKLQLIELDKVPENIPLKDMLREVHEAFVKKKEPVVGKNLKIAND